MGRTTGVSGPTGPQGALPRKNRRYLSEQDQRGTKCTDCPSLPTNSPRSHCTVCHQTFDGVTKFDNHRYEGRCVDPSWFGWELRHGYWSSKEGHDKDDRTRDRLAATRAAKQKGHSDPSGAC